MKVEIKLTHEEVCEAVEQYIRSYYSETVKVAKVEFSINKGNQLESDLISAVAIVQE